MKRFVKTYWTILLALASSLSLIAANSKKTDHSNDALSVALMFAFLGFGTIVTVIAIVIEKKKKAKNQANQPTAPLKTAAPAPKPSATTFQPYTGGGVCDVCSKSLSGRKAWIVPNDVFYKSSQYRNWVRTHMNPFGIKMDDTYFYLMYSKDTSAGSAVCEGCIRMFDGTPLPYPSSNSGAVSSGASTAEIKALVDKLAHYSSLVIDDNEKEKMGKKLLEYGTPAVRVIDDYLVSCGRGQQSAYWWNGAADLVRLLPQFPDADCELIFKRLLNVQTNIWEYQTQVKDVAEQELLKLKKAKEGYDDSSIPAENAMAELKSLYNRGGTPEERIKKAIDMQPSVENWSDESKAFYYYIIGDALKRRDNSDQRRFAFFAAQLFYQPVNTSLGWVELKRGMPEREIDPSPETAKKLHEEFPLPASLDELLN